MASSVEPAHALADQVVHEQVARPSSPPKCMRHTKTEPPPTVRALNRMPQQPTSLLSLPDELLVQIFDYFDGRFRKGVHPISPIMLVCCRICSVA